MPHPAPKARKPHDSSKAVAAFAKLSVDEKLAIMRAAGVKLRPIKASQTKKKIAG